MEEKRVLWVVLARAQKQAPVGAPDPERMPAADEIRLAQVALQEAMYEKDYDIREVPLAEARLERLQKEASRQATPNRTCSVQSRSRGSKAAGTVGRDFVGRFAEREGFQTSSRIHRDDAFRSTTSKDGWWTNTWSSPMRSGFSSVSPWPSWTSWQTQRQGPLSMHLFFNKRLRARGMQLQAAWQIFTQCTARRHPSS